jgi:hypothetical protein
MPQVSYFGLFPFCPIVTTNADLFGSGTYYPAGFTLEEFCYLYWKIKKFRFAGDVYPSPPNTWHIDSCLDYYPLYDGPFSPYSHDPIIQGYFIPNNELDLVCNWTQDYFMAFEGRGYGVIFFYGSFLNMPNLYYYDNKYWPWIEISTPVGSSFKYDIDAPFLHCTFLGKTVEIWGGDPEGNTELDLTITACEEWPYNP